MDIALAKGKYTDKIFEQLRIHRENAIQMLRTLEAQRQTAEAKAMTFVAISEDIERMERTMRSAMSQSTLDLLAYSRR